MIDILMLYIYTINKYMIMKMNYDEEFVDIYIGIYSIRYYILYSTKHIIIAQRKYPRNCIELIHVQNKQELYRELILLLKHK